jgi:acetyl-CoA C-acetyltransferase
MLKQVYIAGTKRTPWGGFCGSLSSLTAPQLGSEAIKAAIAKAGIKPTDVDEVMMGNVVSAGCGQNIARQASLEAGLPKEVPCQTINKVCGSSLQTVVTASQAIQCGDADLVVAGGTESMSNAPYLMYKARTGFRMGDGEVVDGLIRDGLSDAASRQHMGLCGEMCAEKYNFTRDKQDAYAVESYKRAQKAQAEGILAEMITPVEIASRKGSVTVSEDEDVAKFNEEKFLKLRPAFDKNGTITAGNASNIDDGAGAMIVCSEEKAKALNIPLEARILGYAVASTDPEWFTQAPALALRKLSERLNLKIGDIDIFELNEAFAVVPMLAMQELKIPHEKVNIYGGAIALGHPIGASGARILGTGIMALHKTGGRIGVASACNGGGEAWVIAFEKV